MSTPHETHSAQCVLCPSPAIAIAPLYNLPICLNHHQAYTEENSQFSSWAERLLSQTERPVSRALLSIAIQRIEPKMEISEQTMKKASLEIDIYIPYQEDHYELWLGPDWRELTAAQLSAYFLPEHTAQIIAHRDLLSAYCAVHFKHPYTPDLTPEDLHPHQFRYIGLAVS